MINFDCLDIWLYIIHLYSIYLYIILYIIYIDILLYIILYIDILYILILCILSCFVYIVSWDLGSAAEAPVYVPQSCWKSPKAGPSDKQKDTGAYDEREFCIPSSVPRWWSHSRFTFSRYMCLGMWYDIWYMCIMCI